MEVRKRPWYTATFRTKKPSGSFDSEIARLSLSGDLNEVGPVDAPLVDNAFSFAVQCPECGEVELFDRSRLMDSISSDPRDPDVEYLKMGCGYEWCLNGGVPVVVVQAGFDDPEALDRSDGLGACLFSDGTYIFIGWQTYLRVL